MIEIGLVFNEPVTSTGQSVLNFNTGSTCGISILNATSTSCSYSVNQGEDISVFTVIGISGDIKDQSGNAYAGLTPSSWTIKSTSF